MNKFVHHIPVISLALAQNKKTKFDNVSDFLIRNWCSWNDNIIAHKISVRLCVIYCKPTFKSFNSVLHSYFNFVPSLSNVYVGILYENEKDISVNPLLITPRNYAFLRIMFMLTAQRILSRIFLKATMHKIYVFAHT